MKSSSGEHYIALDHVRALAIFLVFTWHFLHGLHGSPIRFNYDPGIFIFSVLNEGHTGVALFMALSGYLFAKLLDGRKIKYSAFFWNRFLRLAPLLILVISAVGIKTYLNGQELSPYFNSTYKGLLLPSWPNGGWSITIEMHFYLLLPLLLPICRGSAFNLLALLILPILLRFYIYLKLGELRDYSYWTLIGKFDHFIFGIIAYRFREHLKGRHLLAAIVAITFLLTYYAFDKAGGFNLNENEGYLWLYWVFLPFLEGLSYSLLISYYDNSFNHSKGPCSVLLSRIGNYSYSIYLLHFFFVFRMTDLLNNTFNKENNFYTACLLSLIGILCMVPIAYLSYKFIESPFLKLRRKYVLHKD